MRMVGDEHLSSVVGGLLRRGFSPGATVRIRPMPIQARRPLPSAAAAVIPMSHLAGANSSEFSSGG